MPAQHYQIRDALFWAPHGIVACGTHNAERVFIRWSDGIWDVLDSWSGSETWGFAALSDAIATVDELQTIRTWSEAAGHTDLKLALDAPMFDIGPTKHGTFLIVGDRGQMVELEPGSRRPIYRSLKGFGVQKPGRTILVCRQLEDHIYVGGRNRLLIRVDGENAHQLLLPSPSNEKSLNIWDVTRDGNGMLWISGLLGTSPVVGFVVGQECSIFQFDSMPGAPKFTRAMNRIWAIADSIWVLEGTSWAIHTKASISDPFISVIEHDRQLKAVTRSGIICRIAT